VAAACGVVWGGAAGLLGCCAVDWALCSVIEKLQYESEKLVNWFSGFMYTHRVLLGLKVPDHYMIVTNVLIFVKDYFLILNFLLSIYEGVEDEVSHAKSPLACSSTVLSSLATNELYSSPLSKRSSISMCCRLSLLL
jgi:hypothetical protein